jgi:hypothetical protein
VRERQHLRLPEARAADLDRRFDLWVEFVVDEERRRKQ